MNEVFIFYIPAIKKVSLLLVYSRKNKLCKIKMNILFIFKWGSIFNLLREINLFYYRKIFMTSNMLLCMILRENSKYNMR